MAGYKRLVIIDGKSVFYRGYFAMGALSTSDGTPTGGVYGFAAIAMEIVRKLSPDKVVVAWDSRTSTAKRKEIFPEYKAGRVKPGDDFYAQIPLLKELVQALGWGLMECDGYEADDIIGTLSKQADEDVDEHGQCKWWTYIVSSDLDMLQVVDENTRMYRLLKGFSQLEELDVAAVEVKYGIKKAQFLDLKALKGDASDNIPGVPGVGEKTAVRLLNDYGDLDGVFENKDKEKGALRKKLTDGEQSARMSKVLATIMLDAPVKLDDVPDLVFDEEKIVPALEKLEFRTLIGRFVKAKQGQKKVQGEVVKAQAVLGEAQADPELSQVAKDKAEAEQKREKTVVKMPDGTLVGWDIKELMHADAGLAEKIIGGAKFWDLAQGAFLLNPLARNITQRDEAAEYARQQAEFAANPGLNKIFVQFDLPLIPILFKMERTGMLIDQKYFTELNAEFAAEVAARERAVWAAAGEEFNINSPMQLADVLFEKLKLPTKGIKKSHRGWSTGVKELEKLQDLHPVIPRIKEYREAAKLLSTYIAPIPGLADKNNRIHTTFTQNVTATGRLSSLNPNLQNIPVRTEVGRRIRTGFVAGPGRVLVSADYSQFELRLAAVMGGDAALIIDFNNGVDIHTKTAAEAFNLSAEQVTPAQRRAAKVVNFGILYGMSVRGLAEATKMSYDDAKAFIERYFELRKPIKDYLGKILEQARSQGYVETYYGRRRPTPDVLSTNFVVRTAAERAAQNMPIQGTEADLMKRAMIQLDKELPEGANMVVQVHDSVIVECDEKQATEVGETLRRVMEGVAPELAIKLEVDVKTGKNWGEI